MELRDFSRIEGSVDPALLRDAHIVGIGAGGAFGLYEALARSGVGRLTVLDFDTVDATNLTRQGYQTDQVGRLKVEALAEHLGKVNGGTTVTGVTKNFLDMSDEELDKLFQPADLLLFLTDSFEAQAFGNKLALRYGKPAIWAGFYARSRCAEVVFTIPGTTPACFRCAVSPRYKAQAESNGGIAVSSNCNTVFHSQILDAMVGMLTMAILHRNTTGLEFSNWFGERWDRNLLQFKVHPEHGTAEGGLFDRVFAPTEGRCFNFNAIWQRIEEEKAPKYEPCPDCGGTGDLRQPAPALHNQ